MFDDNETELSQLVASLSEKYEDFNWWVPNSLSILLDEVAKELPAGHPLEGRNLVPLARSVRNDDVLYHDGKSYIVVHLTWNSSNILPFPLFKVIEEDDIARFLRNDYLEESKA